MSLDGLEGQVHFGRDRDVAKALRHQGEDRPFPFGEARSSGSRCRRRPTSLRRSRAATVDLTPAGFQAVDDAVDAIGRARAGALGGSGPGVRTNAC